VRVSSPEDSIGLAILLSLLLMVAAGSSSREAMSLTEAEIAFLRRAIEKAKEARDHGNHPL
jgi:hypothetical protein